MSHASCPHVPLGPMSPRLRVPCPPRVPCPLGPFSVSPCVPCLPSPCPVSHVRPCPAPHPPVLCPPAPPPAARPAARTAPAVARRRRWRSGTRRRCRCRSSGRSCGRLGTGGRAGRGSAGCGALLGLRGPGRGRRWALTPGRVPPAAPTPRWASSPEAPAVRAGRGRGLEPGQPWHP